MIITLTEQEIQEAGFPKFYDALAEKIGLDPKKDEIRYDCTKILIAKNIQDAWFKNAGEEDRISFAMLLVVYGPKVSKYLKPYEVDVPDGSIYYMEDKNEENIK